MPFYHSLGTFPHKRHTIFTKPDGQYYYEQLFGTEGFHGKSSLLYHIHRPTQITKIESSRDISPVASISKNITPRKFYGYNINPENDFLDARVTLLFNSHTQIELAAPKFSMQSYFYKNADADEVHFIHKGSGALYSLFGKIDFKAGDYIIIPRGTIYQYHFEHIDNRILITQSKSPVEFPKRYTNGFGQLLEHAPFCERDIKLPVYVDPINRSGDHILKIRKENQLHTLVYKYHPFDVVGWDGFLYPYAFSIYDFEPITGRIHQPPPVHQTFESKGFVICSFVPRLFDYHPQAVPAPYNHSNIDSEELIYYVDGEFMSRTDIKEGQLTLHPGGIPHGPAPGAMEKSIGAKETKELAVMIDTFQPLQITQAALDIDDGLYYASWTE